MYSVEVTIMLNNIMHLNGNIGMVLVLVVFVETALVFITNRTLLFSYVIILDDHLVGPIQFDIGLIKLKVLLIDTVERNKITKY